MEGFQGQSSCYQGISTILCADWGKESRKRAVYAADTAARRVYRLRPRLNWSLSEVLDAGSALSSNGPVLAAFDVPLGVPESYLAAAATVFPGAKSPQSFLELLPLACSTPRFFEATIDAADWKIERPFFSVPAGEGGLTSYIRAAAQRGIDLRRSIDKRTKAKTLFIKAGIPGSVGSAACSLWAELGPLLDGKRKFGMWPFDGDLGSLLRSFPIVLGEMYPRAAYSTALSNESVQSRAPMFLAKTDINVRLSAIAALKAAQWVEEHGVRLEDLGYAQANEDDFDACVTAAAFLRCQLEQVPLSEPWAANNRIKGGILGTASVSLGLRERTFGSRISIEPGIAVNKSRTAVISGQFRGTFSCPIAGCKKVYQGTRGGWDGHVGSLRMHPLWHPKILSAEERKKLFVSEFPHFFS